MKEKMDTTTKTQMPHPSTNPAEKKARATPIRRKIYERLGDCVDDVTQLIGSVYALDRGLADIASDHRDGLRLVAAKLRAICEKDASRQTVIPGT